MVMEGTKGTFQQLDVIPVLGSALGIAKVPAVRLDNPAPVVLVRWRLAAACMEARNNTQGMKYVVGYGGEEEHGIHFHGLHQVIGRAGRAVDGRRTFIDLPSTALCGTMDGQPRTTIV